MITRVADFARYFKSVRERTLRFLDPIPPEQIDFAPYPGKFTLGGLIRHLASSERMFAEVALSGRWAYPGHGPELGATKDEAVAYLMAAHAEATARLRDLPDESLHEKRPTPDGRAVSAWRLLMLMPEHEIHHRSQVSQYLIALGIQPPQIFGMRWEHMPKA